MDPCVPKGQAQLGKRSPWPRGQPEATHGGQEQLRAHRRVGRTEKRWSIDRVRVHVDVGAHVGDRIMGSRCH